MEHWKELYTGKYRGMELIDRKLLLQQMGFDSEEKVGKAFDDGIITEETTDILSFINGAEVINPVSIVLEYEKNVEKEKRTNP